MHEELLVLGLLEEGVLEELRGRGAPGGVLLQAFRDHLANVFAVRLVLVLGKLNQFRTSSEWYNTIMVKKKKKKKKKKVLKKNSNLQGIKMRNIPEGVIGITQEW